MVTAAATVLEMCVQGAWLAAVLVVVVVEAGGAGVVVVRPPPRLIILGQHLSEDMVQGQRLRRGQGVEAAVRVRLQQCLPVE